MLASQEELDLFSCHIFGKLTDSSGMLNWSDLTKTTVCQLLGEGGRGSRVRSSVYGARSGLTQIKTCKVYTVGDTESTLPTVSPQRSSLTVLQCLPR